MLPVIEQHTGIGPRYAYDILMNLAPHWVIAVPLITVQGNLGIGFIGFAQSSGASVMYSYENPDFANDMLNLENTKEFLIHPAYHMALNVKSVYVH